MAQHSKDIQQINGVFHVTIKLAAQFCGVSANTMIIWRDKVSPPPYDAELKLYPINDLGEWIRTEQIYKQGVGGVYPYKPDMTRYPGGKRKRKTPVNMMPGGKEPPRPEDQDERLKRLKADKLELEIKVKVGTYVLADEVLLAMSSMVSRVKTRLLALPAQLAPTLAGKTDPTDTQEYLDEELRVALEELSADHTREIEFGAEDDEDET